MIAKVVEIYRYPVKSMGAESLPTARLQDCGIPGDRCWALKDEDRGGFKVGKRFAAVMGMHAELLREPSTSEPSPEVRITLADGGRIDSRDSQANDVLSEAIGSAVSIWPLLPKDNRDHYRRAPPDPDVDPQTRLREVFARNADEALPDLRHFPRELFEYESPLGTYFDAFPLLVLTRQSLAHVAAANTGSRFDVRRFRPNIVLDVTQDDAGGDCPEESWAGRRARLGTATIEFAMACPRCVMTTHGFADLPRDPQIMRALVKANNGNLGVYATVVAPGDVAVGARLELL